MDRSMIDVASGGALMDKTPIAARHLISNMASNTQQFGIRGAGQPWMVNEIDVVDNLRLENQLPKLTSLVMQLVVRQHQPSIAARVCGICTSVKYPNDMCPMWLSVQEVVVSESSTKVFDYLGSITDEADCDESWEVHNLSNPEDDIIGLANLSQGAELLDLLDQVCKYEDLECPNNVEVQVAETKN
ncbi:hypothetical protein CR513_32239, partial [Mucuna pruriens]